MDGGRLRQNENRRIATPMVPVFAGARRGWQNRAGF
jgi:hypothetical protein